MRLKSSRSSRNRVTSPVPSAMRRRTPLSSAALLSSPVSESFWASSFSRALIWMISLRWQRLTAAWWLLVSDTAAATKKVMLRLSTSPADRNGPAST